MTADSGDFVPTPSTGPRFVTDADFPATASVGRQLQFLLNYAVLAPSAMNAQPWRFVVKGHKVFLFADRSRQLLTIDPDGRELTIGCGAALHHLRVAAAHYGFESAIEPLPSPEDQDLLATFVLTNPKRASDEDEKLFNAISVRRTNRRPFADRPVPSQLSLTLERVAREEHAQLTILTSFDMKNTVATLVEEGVRLAEGRPEASAEIHKWLRSNRDNRRDGVPDSEQGIWDRRSDLRSPATLLAPRKRELVQNSPAIFVLATNADDAKAWLAAGQALSRILLLSADRGLFASYMNQPVEISRLRVELSKLIGGGFPQLVFRVGYPSYREGTPRRSVQDVLGS